MTAAPKRRENDGNANSVRRESVASRLPKDAIALRPVRIVGDAFRYYSATTFPKGPWAGCEITLRRCQAFGMLLPSGDHSAYAVIDVLSDHDTVIADFGITQKGFKYLRRVLRFVVEDRPRTAEKARAAALADRALAAPERAP